MLFYILNWLVYGGGVFVGWVNLVFSLFISSLSVQYDEFCACNYSSVLICCNRLCSTREEDEKCYIITVVPVNILGDGYPNKTIGYLNIIIKCVMFASHTVIIPDEEPVATSTISTVVTTSFNGSNQCSFHQ